jgi:hypothetical protein
VLVAAAVCPCPPLLVAGVGRPDADLDDLRARCARAAASVVDVSDVLYLVGADLAPHATSLGPWAPGADSVQVRVPEPLPLPLLVGAALLGPAGRSYVAVAPDLAAADCAELGRDLADSADRVALLVMADGAARHSERAPGFLDERAAGFDAAVAAALAEPMPAALLDLDPQLATDLLATGRVGWQVLAGAAGDRPVRTVEVWFGAPYGVGYHVAEWRR